ncbi:aldo/keto reductase [Streptomyces silvisoli]|uniref:Aldo/keto reductase n=1 Tax=Streptomyces silvisoli TaxID=3034235 RepID=A0ABT5ZKF3_9ACTN|nr:aldo/keto reductase [Streptomyces silvisoli]MDF3290312.1 aldo/keto reductase [Streptomyces silvisoli]
MEYTQLGRTGLQVSRVVLCTGKFGPAISEADSFTVMDAALGVGINVFANVYDWGENKGQTEKIIGNWFAQGGGRREKVVLATKLYASMAPDNDPSPNMGRLSALNIRRSVEAGLERLRTDCIDLLQLHHVDRNTPWEEIWQAIDVLVQQGKILYAGSSNHAGWHIAQANETAGRRGSLGLVVGECLYNLAERRAEMEVIPAAQSYGLGVWARSPLHGGLLGGVLRRLHEGGAMPTARGRAASAAKALENPAIRDRVQAYEDLVDQYGLDPGEVALAWLLTRPSITGPAIGPGSVECLETAVRAVQLQLPQELLTALEEVFPGPGPSPEAFAW